MHNSSQLQELNCRSKAETFRGKVGGRGGEDVQPENECHEHENTKGIGGIFEGGTGVSGGFIVSSRSKADGTKLNG